MSTLLYALRDPLLYETSGAVADFVTSQPIVDVHEHHLPELASSTDVDLLKLFQQSYAGWTQARPYPLPSETREEDPMLVAGEPTRWAALRPYLEDSGSTMFVRNLLRGISQLHKVPPEGITENTWEAVDAQVRKAHASPRFLSESLVEAGLVHVITDAYSQPLLNARQAFGPSYSSVVRINAFALGWHPNSRDHNGNSAHELLTSEGLRCDTFDHYLTAIESLLKAMPSKHQVAIKNALAYDRFIDFEPASTDQARAAWGDPDPSPQARKHFGDYVVDHICALCADYNLPMQMHLGTAIIRGSHPLNVASLIERHPKTRFLLMHLAYPWSRDLLGLAFVYRNIWLDLTWSALLSPSHFKLALHEAIEILPDDSRMMFGGDNWHMEETVGTILTFKSLITEVLQEKVLSGYFDLHHAQRLATRILSRNAIEFFDLKLNG